MDYLHAGKEGLNAILDHGKKPTPADLDAAANCAAAFLLVDIAESLRKIAKQGEQRAEGV